MGAAASLEFVPRAADGSGWDNPPGGGNYALHGVPTGKSVAVLRDGELALVDLSFGEPWILVADMDGTLIGDPHETVDRLNRFWDLRCKFAIRPTDGVKLCQLAYNSGRNKQDMLKGCRENDLPRPDYMICGVGTEVYVPAAPNGEGPEVKWCDCPQQPAPDVEWRQLMEREFGDRERVAIEVAAQFPSLVIHGSVEHDQYRIPCQAHITPEEPDILERLQAWGDSHKTLRVIISGCGDTRYVDVCSKKADKGLAIDFLFGRGGFAGISDKSRILVAGDSGNDLRMFMVPGVRSVMVGNSQESLVRAVLEQASDPSLASAQDLQLPLVVPRTAPLAEVYYAKGVVGDGVREAIHKYYLGPAPVEQA